MRPGQEEARLQKIEGEDLPAILEAQEERQQQMLEAVLEVENQQQQALLERVEQILTAIGPTASRASAAEFVTNALSTRLPEFIHDPDNGCTYDEDAVAEDGSALDEAERARLIVSKLDAAAYARFTNQILPKRASELCFDDNVKTLKELFGHNTSVFARHYTYLRTQHNGEPFSYYTGTAIRRHETAEFNAITPEQAKCLIQSVYYRLIRTPQFWALKRSSVGNKEIMIVERLAKDKIDEGYDLRKQLTICYYRNEYLKIFLKFFLWVRLAVISPQLCNPIKFLGDTERCCLLASEKGLFLSAVHLSSNESTAQPMVASTELADSEQRFRRLYWIAMEKRRNELRRHLELQLQ
ncbi:unnamed protein product [Toxocara canis]|uniref:DUF7083 domain-containing protein n=1 Tax=Toxocara canis TaxID=6265 RepID=A0A183UFJ4_TOXCA|nr:unnamed protein product [Toxocara canis]